MTNTHEDGGRRVAALELADEIDINFIVGADHQFSDAEARVIQAALRSAANTQSQGVMEALEDWSCVADFLDDIEVDDKGLCRWSDVANAQTHIRHTMRAVSRVATPEPSVTGGVVQSTTEQTVSGLRSPNQGEG